jgi:hypothetical protein
MSTYALGCTLVIVAGAAEGVWFSPLTGLSLYLYGLLIL